MAVTTELLELDAHKVSIKLFQMNCYNLTIRMYSISPKTGVWYLQNV